ncbi:PASTA domain-containing protein [Diaminobutyricibacter tongyongensis]|uniref:PASTA domain-containing protein n=1 Tax=Leifsonia tongyongensis TaxID=1268043 RepID=A0A6L9XZK7_9MICO|nr:PASTA domain-containing protein [Diaminobutyricibacter tongyongensis]NEN06830.1 PASTA domain-containing protein [Diaminobutyricibacter tongyongensis]
MKGIPAEAQSPTAPSSTTLGSLPPWALTGAIILVVVVVGVLLVVNGWPRAATASSSADRSVVRSWIAVSLVVGLLVLTAAEIAGNNATTTSALIGGLTASVGSAIAYYFSTKASEQAQEKLTTAAGSRGGPIVVPDLMGKSVNDALLALGSLELRLVVDPTAITQGTVGTIVGQVPSPGPSTVRDKTVTVTLGS